MSPSFTSDTSFNHTIKELPSILPHSDPSPSGPSRSSSPENCHGYERPVCGASYEASNTQGGRSRWRRSLSTVLGAVMDVTSRAPSMRRDTVGPEEIERGRTRVRNMAEEQSWDDIQVGEGIPGAENCSQLGANASHQSGHGKHHSLDLGRVLGLERGQKKEQTIHRKSKEYGEGWREFTPGMLESLLWHWFSNVFWLI